MNEQTLFRALIHRSVQLLWQRPLVALLGILAAGIGGMGVVELLYSFFKFFQNATVLTAKGVGFARLSAVYYWLLPPYHNLVLPVLGILLLLISVVVFMMTVIGFGALIAGVVDGKKPLHELWHTGTRHMWHMAALVLGRRLVITLIALATIFGGRAILLHFGVWSHGIVVGLWIIAVVLMAVVTFLSIFTATSMIIDGLHIKDAIIKAVAVFRDHVPVSIEMAIVMFFVELIVVVLLLSLFVMIGIPVYLLGVISFFTKINSVFKVGLVFAIFVLFALGLFAAGFVTMFEVSCWAGLYVRTRQGIIKSRFLNFFGVNK